MSFALRTVGTLALLVSCILPLVADPARQAKRDKKTVSHELVELYSDELADRADRARLGDKTFLERRKARIERVTSILANERLVKPEDFHCAARLIALREDDRGYLLAHVLSSIAAFERVPNAHRGSAEYFDRYLLELERPQLLCSVLDGDDANDPPRRPFADAVNQSFRERFGLDALHYADRKAESRQKKPKSANSREIARLAASTETAGRLPTDAASACTRVREILGEGGLSSGADYFLAATVLMRGDSTDLAYAHLLGLLAAFEKHPGSRQLAAEALDEFLQSLKRPPAFGSMWTQASEGAAVDEWGKALASDVRGRYELPVPAPEGSKR